MHKQRLLKLARLLEADASEKRGIKFDLDVVAQTNELTTSGKVAVDCGTTACAMGLAAISGAFKRQGLSYKAGLETDFFSGGDLVRIGTTYLGRLMDYDRAAMKVFGLTNKQANFLFTSTYYKSDNVYGAGGERLVAKRIRNFVAGKDVPPDYD